MEITFSWGWLIVALTLAIAVYSWWNRRRQSKRQAVQMGAIKEAIFLKVQVPKEQKGAEDERKDYRDLISVFEPFLAGLTTLYRKGPPTIQPVFSLEILAKKGEINFYIATPPEYVELIERQLHSQYPSASLERAEDFQLFEGENKPYDAAAFKLSRSYVLPLRTYRDIEVDSLNSITNALSKLGQTANGAVQLLIRPVGDYWFKKIDSSLKGLMEGKDIEQDNPWHKQAGSLLGDIGKQVFTSSPKDKSLPTEEDKRLTPKQQNEMELLKTKMAKQALEVQLRCIVTAPGELEAKTYLNTLLAAFGQFNTPDRNNLKLTKRPKTEIVKNYLYRSFHEGDSLILNTEEITSLYHLPTRNVDTPNIKWLGSRKLPPPTNLPNEGIKIGESVYRGETKPIYLLPDDRLRHVYMIGKTGVGKTVTFENMIEQDIQAGHGVAYLDPNGDAIEWILSRIPKERAEDVIYFNPSDTARPFGLNLLEWKRPEDRDFLVQEATSMFYKLFDPGKTGIVGPQFEHWLRNAALTLMAQPGGGTLVEIPRLFVDKAFERQAVAHVTDPVVRSFWEKQMAQTSEASKSEMLNYFISKFGRFMTNDMMRNIIGQAESSFDFRDVMDHHKILLVNLSKGLIGEINAQLLGMIIVTKLQIAAFSRQDVPENERQPFYLYVDEFQNFTTDTFATILSEARKYRLSLHITNQYIAQLEEKIRDAVIGNVGTLMSFRIGAADAEFLTNEMDGLTVEDLTNIDKRYFYIKTLIDNAPTKPFSGHSTDWTNDGNTTLAAAIKELSRLQYGRDGQEVAARIMQRSKVDELPIRDSKESNPVLS